MNQGQKPGKQKEQGALGNPVGRREGGQPATSCNAVLSSLSPYWHWPHHAQLHEKGGAGRGVDGLYLHLASLDSSSSPRLQHREGGAGRWAGS